MPIYYIFLILLFLIGIITGTYGGPTTNATTILIFMLIFPLCIIDRPWRLNCLLGVVTAVFCVADIYVKSGEILSLDIANTVVVCFLSMFFASMNVRRKLHGFELRRREREAASKKDAFINAIPTGIAIYEIRQTEVKQVFMNDSYFGLMGDSRESRMRRSKGDFMNNIYPEDQEKVKESVRHILEGASQTAVTCRAIKGDGSLLWVRFTASVAERCEDFILVYTAYVSMEEEVQSKNALEQSQTLLESAIQSADMTVFEYDCIRRRIIQRESSIEKHGLKTIIEDVPESLIVSGYCHKDSADSYRDMFERLHQTGTTVQGEFYVKQKNSLGYWWEHVILTPIFDEKGNMIKAVGTSMDVTERKEKEKRYYQQIGIMSSSAENNLITKIQYNLTRREIVYASAMRDDAILIQENEGFETVLDKLVPVVVGDKSRKRVLEALDRDRLLRNFAAGAVEEEIEYKRRVPGAAITFAKMRCLMSADPQTNDIMLFIYCYDNTERMIEEKIVEQLGSSEYDVIGIIDVATGDYVVKNMKEIHRKDIPPAGNDFYGMCERVIRHTVVPENQKEMLENIHLENIIYQLADNESYAFPYSVLGREKKILRKKLQFRYLDQSKSSILYTCSDITDIYQQEQEQLQKIQRALVEAKQATQAKTDFLSRMSHDIRTPLNAILGSASLAQDETDDSEAVRNYLETIESSGRFLLGLINDILDISKIESGKIELRPEVCRVSDFAHSVEMAIRPLMEKKHIEFIFKMNCGFHTIFVDKLRHQQIFFNLLSNAAKYTPEGGRVEYTTEAIPAPEGMVGVRNTVRDNGIGMTEAYMSHLFEPFTRDNNAVINQTEGSGLGLAIVKNIVDAMGGRIHVNSELGKGFEFIVDLYMPLVAAEKQLDRKPVNQDERILKGKQVLLVEDNVINTRIASKLLEKKGCVVISAVNGQEAVDVFREAEAGAIDLILMDIRMPVMNGLEAARSIRELKKADSATVPIIAMTADAFSEDIIKTEEAGMNGHLPKPVEPDKLYQILIENLT
ncbi:MAG: response regulator [Lachnospiraceae bacterium]|nr:response regulator [Lachnospiraceae bacterium]